MPPLRNLPLPSKVLQDSQFLDLQTRMAKDLFAFDAEQRKESDALSLERIGSLQLPEDGGVLGAPATSVKATGGITGTTGYEGMLGDTEAPDIGDTAQEAPYGDTAPATQPRRATGLMSPTLDMPAMMQPQRRQAVYDPTSTIDIQGEPDYDPSADTGSSPGRPAPADPSSWEGKAYGAAVKAGHPNPQQFVEQIRWESGGFDPDVIAGTRKSSMGAEGIAQIVRRYHPDVDPLNPDAALDYAARLMKTHYDQYGDSDTALAAYNGGAGAVAAMRAGHPYGETQQYLREINSRVKERAAVANPATPPTQRAAEGRAQTGETRLSRVSYPLQQDLTDPDKWAVCGPLAAMAFASANGTPIDYETAKAKATAAGWTAAGGMAGPASQVALLKSLNVPATMEAVNWEKVKTDVRNGNPVMLSSPGGSGHYFVVQGVDEQGRLDLGNSALTLKGGRRWMTPEEVRSLGPIGAVDTAIYMDNPTSPTPSHAVSVTKMPPANEVAPKIIAERDALALTADLSPAGSSPSAPAGGPTPAGVSELDQARASTGGGDIMARNPLDSGVPVRDRWADEPQVPYDPDQGPRETGYTVPGPQPSSGPGSVSVAAGSEQARPATAPYDLDQGPREATPGSVGAQTIISPMAPPENPGVSVTAAQPAPPQIQISQGGPPTPSAQWTPVETAPPRAAAAPATEQYIDQSVPAPPGWQAIVDGAGNVVDWVRERVQDAYAVPADQRPPQYSGPSYAQPQVPEGQRPYFAPTETEVGAVRAGIEATQAAEPAGTSWLPEPLQRPAGAALGALQTVQAASDAVKARIDPRVWGFARDGIAREILSPAELDRWTQLGSATHPDGTPKSYADYQREQAESQAFADRVEARYQQIKDDPDALTRYANASPAYAATAAVTDLAVAPAVGALASGAARAGATAAGAGARTARAAGYAADVAGQSIVDPTSLPLQPAADAALRGIGAATRATGRAARGLAEEGARRLVPGAESVADDGVQMLGSGVVPSRRVPTPDPRQIEQRAVQEFGTTDNLHETGFILNDGTGLNMTGRTQGTELLGDIDHMQIGRATGVHESEAAERFMRDTGAMRIRVDPYALDAAVPIPVTPAQKRALIRAARDTQAANIDVIDPQLGDLGESIGYRNFRLPQQRGDLSNFVASLPEQAADGGTQMLGSGVVPRGLSDDVLNAAGGGVFGAASEDLQAQQEGREADPAERVRRALIGAGLATAGGRYARRGPAAERARAAQRLGSGVVGNESMNAATRTHVIPPHVADELDFPVRNPTDPAVLRAIEAAGGTVDERGTTLNVIRNHDPKASGGTATRDMVFYIAGPKGTPNPYASSTEVGVAGVGGTVRIEGETRFRSPLFISAAPGEARGFDDAMRQMGLRTEDPQKPFNWNTALDDLADQAEQSAGPTSKEVEQGIREAKRAGPAGSPARAQALKDLVTKYGGDPDRIDPLMDLRGAEMGESVYAIKENIVAGNARRQQYDGVVTVQPRSPAPDEIAKHPAVKAVEAERFEINRRLGQITREIDAQYTTLGPEPAEGAFLQDPKIAGLVDEYNQLYARRDQIPQALEDAKTQAYRELTEGRITELADPREARNPTPGSPTADLKAAYKRAKDAERAVLEIEDSHAGALSDETYVAHMRALTEQREANAALDALMNEADVPTGYELRPDIPRRGDVRASTIEENPGLAETERNLQTALNALDPYHAQYMQDVPFTDRRMGSFEEWARRTGNERAIELQQSAEQAEAAFEAAKREPRYRTAQNAALPFDPASAAAGGAAGAASEDEEGQQGDPLRTGAGMLMAGIVGRGGRRLGHAPTPRLPTRAIAAGADPSKLYEFRYRVANLADLILSHTPRGEPNPAFPRELQPRARERAASQMQIDQIARGLVPDALLDDAGRLDSGPMIVGADNIVESGNGRVLALNRASSRYPEQYQSYTDALRAKLPEYGLDESALQGVDHPVLVRERVTDVDRAAFAAEANQTGVLRMSSFEQAVQDASNLTDDAVTGLTVGENDTIASALRKTENRGLVRQWVGTLPENERGGILDANGDLSAQGYDRLTNAMLVRTYGQGAGERLAQAFIESADPSVRNVQTALMQSLPDVARSEALIRAGQRDAGLSIAEDVAAATDMLARLRREGVRIDEYLSQSAMFERELTPLQEDMLGFLATNQRRPSAIREALKEYASRVENTADPNQVDMFGGQIAAPTREDLWRGATAGTAEATDDLPLFGAAEANPPAGGVPTDGAGLESPTGPAIPEPAAPAVPGQARPPVAPRPGSVPEDFAPSGGPAGVLEQEGAPPRLVPPTQAERGTLPAGGPEDALRAQPGAPEDVVKQFHELIRDPEKADAAAVAYQQLVDDGASPEALTQFRKNAEDSRWWDRFDQLRYASMLSDPVTHGQNAIGNVQLGAVDVIERPLTALLDKGRAAVTGGPREAFMAEGPAQVIGMVGASRQALKDAAFIMAHGLRPEDAAKLDRPTRGFGTNIPGIAPRGSRRAGAVDFAMEGPLRALSAADALFRGTMRGGHLTSEATRAAIKANGGNPVTPEAVKRFMTDPAVAEAAEKRAAQSVLQEDRALTTAINLARAKLPSWQQAIVSTVIPYIKTPYNIVAQGVGMTPAGVVSLIGDIRAGKPMAERERRVSRMLIGGAIMAWAGYENMQGLNTGAYPESEAERSTLPPGWRPFSRKVTLGDQTYYVPLALLGPLGIPAAVSILATEQAKKGDPFTAEKAAKVAEGMGKFAEDQTFLRSISDATEALSKGGNSAQNYLERQVSQFSPHIVGGGGIGRRIEAIRGTPSRDPEGGVQAFLATLPYGDQLADMLGVEKTAVRRDVLGRPSVSNPEGAAALVPIRASVEHDAAVIRAYRKAGEGLPRNAPKTVRDPDTDESRTLSRRQQGRWQVEFGQAVRDEWENQGRPADKETLKKVEGAARKRAAEAVLSR